MDIVSKPKSKSVVSSKWIWKIKYVADGSKARFVARGFSQREGIDYEETLSLGRKAHFHWNYHGTCFHDEVGYTPYGCKDKPSLMVWLRKRFISNSHMDLKSKIEWLMYVSWKILCMDWSKLLEIGMEE